MPRGVYKRTKPMTEAQREGLRRGHDKEARQKALAAIRENARKPEWIEKMSVTMTAVMADPEVKERHRLAIQGAPNRFKGGNGQGIPPALRIIDPLLCSAGWIREHPIPTKGHGTAESPPRNYKADYALLDQKIVLEFDGQEPSQPQTKGVGSKRNNRAERNSRMDGHSGSALKGENKSISSVGVLFGDEMG